MDISKRVAQLVREACIREVSAPKPGNVNRNHNFSDTAFEDFILSAEAVVPAFEKAGQTGVGRIVWQAITDCRSQVRSNTNLGIVLLLAPLAKACLEAGEKSGSVNTVDTKQLRQVLHDVLHSLTVEDARLAYEAIRVAKPGGMHKVSAEDITEEPSVSLLEAMELAKATDAIASEYVTDFEITFEIAFPALKEALSRGADYLNAVVHAFLYVLSRVPDTLIARKNGAEISRQISHWAADALTYGGVYSSLGRGKISRLDNVLCDRTHKLNPGTTADLTTAAIFLDLYSEL